MDLWRAKLHRFNKAGNAFPVDIIEYKQLLFSPVNNMAPAFIVVNLKQCNYLLNLLD